MSKSSKFNFNNKDVLPKARKGKELTNVTKGEFEIFEDVVSGKISFQGGKELEGKLLVAIPKSELEWDEESDTWSVDCSYEDNVRDVLSEQNRFVPPKERVSNTLSNNASLGSSNKKSQSKQVSYDVVETNGITKINLIGGDWFHFKDQLKEMIPYTDRTWSNVYKMWIIDDNGNNRELVANFVQRINEGKAATDREWATSKHGKDHGKPLEQAYYNPPKPLYKNENVNLTSIGDQTTSLLTIVGNTQISYNRNENMEYQVLTGVLVRPQLGQNLTCQVGDVTRNFKICKIMSKLQFLAVDENNQEEYFVVSAGVWTNHKEHLNSKIEFLPI